MADAAILKEHLSPATCEVLHALSQKEPSQAQRLEALLADDLRKLLSLPAAAKRAKMDDGPQAASAAPADATQSSSPARVPLVSIANMVSCTQGPQRGKVDVKLCVDGVLCIGKKAEFWISKAELSHVIAACPPDTHSSRGEVFLVLYLKDATTVTMKAKAAAKMQVEATAAPSDEAARTLQGQLVEKYSSSVGVDLFGLLSAAYSKSAKIDFVDARKERPLKCHLKVTEGFAYLLRQGVLFLTKTLFLPVSTIEGIHKGGATLRTFEIELVTEEKKKHTLSMIGREHEHVVENFLRDLEKRAKASGGDVDDNGDEDSEDDEPDFDANAEAAAMDSCDEEYDEEGGDDDAGNGNAPAGAAGDDNNNDNADDDDDDDDEDEDDDFDEDEEEEEEEEEEEGEDSMADD